MYTLDIRENVFFASKDKNNISQFGHFADLNQLEITDRSYRNWPVEDWASQKLLWAFGEDFLNRILTLKKEGNLYLKHSLQPSVKIQRANHKN